MEDDLRLLSGVRVVEVATMVFAPSACAVLADFGAEVIKVEQPGKGDLNRHYHKLPSMPISPVPYAFQMDNRNKKSVALDVKREEGHEIFQRLITTADIFVSNYRPAALQRLRLTYEDLRPLNPRLIYALGTAHGEEGPEKDKPGYDAVSYWSRSAIESQIFPVRDWLGPLPYGSGDHPSGMALYGAIVSALYHREKTGRGGKVSSSLLANGTWANSTLLQAQLSNAEFRPRAPREKSYNFTYIHYKTKDGRLLKLSIVNQEKYWAPFCRAVGRPDLIDDPRFSRLEVRRENMEDLIRIFDESFLGHELAHWVKTLEEFDIPFAVLPTYEEAADDPQKAANDIIVALEHPRFGSLRTVNSPIEVAGCEKVKPTAAPELGEHTTEVLQELGYSKEEIERLLSKGVTEQFAG